MLGRAAYADLAFSGPEAPALLQLLELRLDAGFHDAGERERGRPIDDGAHALDQDCRQRQGNSGLGFCRANSFHDRMTTTV